MIVLFKDFEDEQLKQNLTTLDVEYRMVDELNKDSILKMYKEIEDAKIIETTYICNQLRKIGIVGLCSELNLFVDEETFYSDFSKFQIDMLKVKESLRIADLMKPIYMTRWDRSHIIPEIINSGSLISTTE